VFSFANQVSDYAVLLTDLEIFRFESNQFGPSKATSNEECQNRTITFASRLPDGGSPSKVLDWSTVNQLPILTPRRFAPLTRGIPAG
jgi:hypothetical protein